MNIQLDEWRTRIILEALRVLEDKWFTTAKASDNEDVQADYGNDLVRLSLVRDQLEATAVKEFGLQVKEFSRQPFFIEKP